MMSTTTIDDQNIKELNERIRTLENIVLLSNVDKKEKEKSSILINNLNNNYNVNEIHEGFKLIWTGYFEVNLWLKSFALWDIMLITTTSEELALWTLPTNKTKFLLSIDPLEMFSNYIQNGNFKNSSLFKDGFDKKVLYIYILLLF